MDAVILAAGRNDRLRGAVPAYMKPLLVINGKTLVTQLVSAMGLCQRVVLVASPENIKPLVDVVSSERTDARFVVQPQADGPVQALSLGLDVVRSAYTLVVCGDNLVPVDHWTELLSRKRPEQGEALISTRHMIAEEVRRFTYFNHDEVLEKEDPPIMEKIYSAWIGPLVFETATLRHIMDEDEPTSLSDIIRNIRPENRTFVEGQCADIGIPGELP